MTGRDPAASGPNEWECRECGALNLLDENICQNCGFDQDGFPPEGEDEEDLEDAEDE